MATLRFEKPDWIASAPIVVRRDRSIAAPPSAVWARIADHETWPEWFTAVRTVRVTGDATGVGGRREVTAPGMTFREVFTVWEPERRFAFCVVEGPASLASMAEMVELTPLDDGSCTITYAQGIEPSRGFGWLWRLLRSRLDRNVGAALDTLAALVEHPTSS